MSNVFSSQFDYQPPGAIYLDSPANGVMSNTTFDAGRVSDQRGKDDVSEYRMHFLMNEMKELRSSLAAQLSIAPSSLALMSSFSVALNYLITGLDQRWRVWSLEGDYPSLIMPFELYAFDLTKAPIPTLELSTARILESIEASKPDLVVLSHVQWLSGFKVELQELGAFCRERGIFTLIDGTQHVGVEPLDLRSLKVDAYGASGCKWLLAGFGNGFQYIDPSFFEQLSIRTGGFGSMLNFENEWKYTESMKNFEPGHLDHIAFVRMKNAVHEWAENDPGQISSFIGLQTNHLLDELKSNGVDVYDFRAVNGMSSIVSLGLSDDQINKLKTEGIRFSKRGGRVRIGCHIYNSRKQLEAFVNTITS